MKIGCKKPDTKEYIWHDAFYINSKRIKSISGVRS